MEQRINSFQSRSATRGHGRPIALIGQLMQQTANVQHVDEIFLWLARAMVQSLNISMVQFLAIQPEAAGTLHVEVRALASQNPSPVQADYVNNQVTAVAKRIFHEQRGVTSRPVESIFPPLPASLFAQHNLRCWAGYFLQNEAFLPPARTAQATPVKLLAPLTMVVSLFTLYPLSEEQIRSVHFILEQSMRIIVSKGFLASPATPAAQKDPNQDLLQTYGYVIPRRAENLEQFLADNPFANATVIADKNARRLYSAIDDEKSLAELAHTTGLAAHEMFDALIYLFNQKRIHFYTRTGERIQNSDFVASLKV